MSKRVVDSGWEDEVYRAVSRALKKLATKLECHTTAINNAPTDKNRGKNHRPTLGRLFGSSVLKQDATLM